MASMMRSRWLHQTAGGMPTLPAHWRNQLKQHGQAVIIVERRAVVAFDA